MKVSVDGRTLRQSTRCEREADARRFLKIREGAAATGAPVPARLDRILYDELAADALGFYRTTGRRSLRELGYRLAHLNTFFRGYRAATIGTTRLTEYVEHRQGQGTRFKKPPSSRTVNLELALLKRILRLAAAADPPKLLRVPRFTMLQEAPARAGFFESSQYDAVRGRLPEDLQAAIAIMHTYGWRKAEVLTLERRQVDLKAGTIRLDKSKNGEARTVYLTPEVRTLLAALIERNDRLSRRLGRIIAPLFPHPGGRRAGEPRRGFRKRWETACRKAGVPERLLHDFRRTAVRNLERASVARSVGMKITGHKTESVYRRYAIVNDADLREAILKLDAARGHNLGHNRGAVVDTRQLTSQNA